VKVYDLGVNGREIPRSFLESRHELDPEKVSLARERSVEVAPGVKVGLLGIGDYMQPDGSPHWAARVLVWRDEVADEASSSTPAQDAG
jgi:hypothetical protein